MNSSELIKNYFILLNFDLQNLTLFNFYPKDSLIFINLIQIADVFYHASQS